MTTRVSWTVKTAECTCSFCKVIQHELIYMYIIGSSSSTVGTPPVIVFIFLTHAMKRKQKSRKSFVEQTENGKELWVITPIYISTLSTTPAFGKYRTGFSNTISHVFACSRFFKQTLGAGSVCERWERSLTLPRNTKKRPTAIMSSRIPIPRLFLQWVLLHVFNGFNI